MLPHRKQRQSSKEEQNSRIPDQNGASLLYIMLEIHHSHDSGWEPSKYTAKLLMRTHVQNLCQKKDTANFSVRTKTDTACLLLRTKTQPANLSVKSTGLLIARLPNTFLTKQMYLHWQNSLSGLNVLVPFVVCSSNLSLVHSCQLPRWPSG